jgi:cytochrome P450
MRHRAGDIHRRQRKLVAPIFSPSNLRELVPTFYDVAERVGVFLKAFRT